MFENILGTVVPFWVGIIVPTSFFLLFYIMRQDAKEWEGTIGSLTMHRRINNAINGYIGFNIGVLLVGFCLNYFKALGGT